MTDPRALDGDATAAELALGLLEGEERAAALRRVLADRAFAAEVAWWRDQFALLVAAVPEAAAPDGVFARVEASLDGRSAPAPRRGWLWPSLAGVMSVAGAVLLTLLLARPVPLPPVAPPRTPVLLAAAITPTAPGEPVTAVFDPAAGTLRLSAAALADPRHSAELWVIGADAVPHSLGVLRPGDRTALTVSPVNRPRLGARATLAVTVEPLGGSPNGQPTGPVVAKGTLTTT